MDPVLKTDATFYNSLVQWRIEPFSTEEKNKNTIHENSQPTGRLILNFANLNTFLNFEPYERQKELTPRTLNQSEFQVRLTSYILNGLNHLKSY